MSFSLGIELRGYYYLQIERELRKEVRKDHEYLYLLLDAMKDSRRARKRAKQPSQPQTERKQSGSYTNIPFLMIALYFHNTGQATGVAMGEEQTKQPSQPQTERKQSSIPKSHFSIT